MQKQSNSNSLRRVVVMMPDALFRRIEKLVKQSDAHINRSTVIRDLLQDALATEERKAKGAASKGVRAGTAA